MRVLVVHPEDELQEEPWGTSSWDRVIDLGTTGGECYANASSKFRCPISRLAEFRNNFQEMRRVRELLSMGMGRLNDSVGMDWWELTSILVHQQLEFSFLLQKLAESLGPSDQVYVTRPGFHAECLRLAIGPRLLTFSASGKSRKGSVRHYFKVLRKFPAAQLLEILWDKTDPGYQLRGLLRRKGMRKSSQPVILLPSAYVNVSSSGMAYAESLPEARFLLVVTRRSGWLEKLPPNVSASWLSHYASVRDSSRRLEYEDLFGRWKLLRNELKTVPEMATLDELGSFDEFPKRFAQGLEIRDAWRNVFDSHPVQGVLCGDDSNPYTHIPLLLAAQKGLPTVAYHHGALDGRYMFKRNHADKILAKGKMEADYLMRLCDVQPQRVEIGAPKNQKVIEQSSKSEEKPLIVFFSEAYEVAGGRAKGFYQDVLPSLADLARRENRQLVIKLHASESFYERSQLIQSTLTSERLAITQVIVGPLRPELLNRTWFAVTIMSSVVVECALQGIPCFLCAWLEAWPYGYVDQFSRFDVGIRLSQAGEIGKIPSVLRNYRVSSAIQESCWTSIEAQRLQDLLVRHQPQQAVAGARN